MSFANSREVEIHTHFSLKFSICCIDGDIMMGAMMKKLTKRYCSASEGDAISQYDTRLLTTSCSSCTPDCASEHKSSKACCSHWPAADIAILSRPPCFQIIFQFLPSPPLPPTPPLFSLSLSLASPTS